MKNTKIKAMTISTLAVLSAVAMTGCGEAKVDMTDYVKVTYEGYDGKAEASVSFDTDAFEEDFGDKLPDDAEVEDMAKLIDECGELDKDDKLSNGDKITYTWELPEDVAKELKKDYKCIANGENIEVTVENLEKLPEGDFIASMDVTDMLIEDMEEAESDIDYEWDGTFEVPVTLSLENEKYTLSIDVEKTKENLKSFLSDNMEGYLEATIVESLGDSMTLDEFYDYCGSDDIFEITGLGSLDEYLDMMFEEFDLSESVEKESGKYAAKDGVISLSPEGTGSSVELTVEDDGSLSGTIDAGDVIPGEEGEIELTFAEA